MSATVDSSLFSNFFSGAPVVHVPGRTFPVESFYLEDLIEFTGHVVEEGSWCARKNVVNREEVSLWVTQDGGEKRRETAEYRTNEDVSGDFPGYSMVTQR